MMTDRLKDGSLGFKKEALRSFRKTARNLEGNDRIGLMFVSDVLSRAKVFTMPNFGVLSDRRTGRHEHVLRDTGYPVVALEYEAVGDNRSENKYEVVFSSKRISLFWNWDGVTPDGRKDESVNISEALCITSLSYIDEIKRWFPIPLCPIYDRNFDWFRPDPENKLVKEGLRTGRFSERATRFGVKPSGTLVLLPDAVSSAVSVMGWPEFMNCMSADVMDEVNACFDFHKLMSELSIESGGPE